MLLSRRAVKVFSVALLFLSMTVAVSAQNIAELKKQATAGDAKAQYNLGVAYANGYGVPEDEAEAVRWWRKAADQGNANAQYRLGVSYSLGQGVGKDGAEAAGWYRKAADQGKLDAQFMVGMAYSTGEGVVKDETEAYFWLNLGAALDDTAKKARDKVGESLTPEKRLEIQERCRKWAEEHSQAHK